ncbi:MAG: acetylxylan esterase [Kiritimatiellae bacterium]|nr:acetylxylan esterase [Kiritimatiellia bacterium]
MKAIAVGIMAATGALLAPAVEVAPAQHVPPLFTSVDADGDGTAKSWRDGRRAEIKRLLEDEVYGRRPVERPPHLVFSACEPDAVMMDGAAVRKRIRVEYGGAFGTNSFTFTAFIPRQKEPAPSFVFICNRPPHENIDPTRRLKSGFWPAEEIVARGYAAITFAFDEVTPDRHHGNTLGVFSAFIDVSRKYRPNQMTEWGALSAWGWGASRILDWIETEPSLDAAHVAVIGHSRGGKAALVAAAWDERFAMACSNDSGTGGAKLLHVDLPKSEHIADSMGWARFWYALAYAKWANRDMEAPFDQHMLVALIAPRLVCIGSATEDDHAGPYGEYLTACHASPVWERVYGLKGFVSDGFPAPEAPQQDGDISYHLRTGKHNLTPYDWNVYMDFADRHGWRKAAK